jgi:hypothetical protein
MNRMLFLLALLLGATPALAQDAQPRVHAQLVAEDSLGA